MMRSIHSRREKLAGHHFVFVINVTHSSFQFNNFKDLVVGLEQAAHASLVCNEIEYVFAVQMTQKQTLYINYGLECDPGNFLCFVYNKRR